MVDGQQKYYYILFDVYSILIVQLLFLNVLLGFRAPRVPYYSCETKLSHQPDGFPTKKHCRHSDEYREAICLYKTEKAVGGNIFFRHTYALRNTERRMPGLMIQVEPGRRRSKEDYR